MWLATSELGWSEEYTYPAVKARQSTMQSKKFQPQMEEDHTSQGHFHTKTALCIRQCAGKVE